MNTLEFNINNRCGRMKPMHAVNNGPIKSRGDQCKSNFNEYTEAGIPYARNHDASHFSGYGGAHVVDVNAVFPDFSKNPEDPKAYDFLLTDLYLKNIIDAGTKIFYRLGASIEHWEKKYNTLPPADFKKWAVICEHIIRHYNEGWAEGYNFGIEYWEIWNEPDLDTDDSTNKRTWGGTKLQFFDFYKTAAVHLKNKFPELKIGGPALASRIEWGDEFLSYMSEKNVPIDFFSWHIYSCDPKAVSQRAVQVREILDENGYTKTESILNEWNYIKGWTDEFVYSIEQIIGMKGSAFEAAVMCACQDSPVDMLMYYDARPCAFNGMFDFYTYRPLKGYYPIKMFSALYRLGSQIECKNDITDIYAVGAEDNNGKAAFMICCYTDDDSATEEKQIELIINGLEDSRLKCFLTDNEHNEETEDVCTDNNGRAEISMKPNSVILLSVN